MTIDKSHHLYADAYGVTGKEPYRLLELSFNESVDGYEQTVMFRICDQTSIVWQDVAWERMPWQVSGEGLSADTEVARPSLMLPNEDRRFSYYAESGLLEGAQVTLYEVHPVELHTKQARVRNYVVARVSGDNEMQVTFELRSPSDGPNYRLPARRYMPPEFPSVKV